MLTATAPTTHDELRAVMDFDRTVRVHADGTVTDDAREFAPDVVYVEGSAGRVMTEGAHWQLLTGYTSQHGYRGPIMHASEYIGGRLADDILSTPGVYVVVEVREPDTSYPEGDPIGWVVATIPDRY